MKQILILILGLFGVAQAQFAPTSTKSAFKWGVSVGTRDSSAYAANDSLVVVINRQGRMMYRSTDGYWKILSNAAAADYVPYTGAVDNVNLGTYRLTARSLKTDSIYANGSGGLHLVSNSGTQVALLGAGGGSNATFYGFSGYDANRAGSYTARSFTDKNYVDSADGLRVRYADTAAMLADYVDLTSTQTISGTKTFTSPLYLSSDLLFNTASNNKIEWVGEDGLIYTYGGSYLTLGSSGNASNLIFDRAAARWGLGTASPTTTFDVNGTVRATALRQSSLASSLVKADVNGILTAASSGSDYTLLNGTGFVRMSGTTPSYVTGTSSQFLKADGSLDGTSYATAASLSGYLPLSGGTLTGDLTISKASVPSLFLTNTSAINYRILAKDDGLFTIQRTGIADLFTMNSSGNVILSGALSGTSLSMSGGGSFGGNVGIRTTSPLTTLTIGTTDATAEISSGGSNAHLTLKTVGASGAIRFFTIGGGTGTLATTESGRFATDGALLINTTTTDGTNKLIVNGGVKGGAFTATDSDARIKGGDAAGRLIVGNSTTETYQVFYGSSHPTVPNVYSLVVNSAERLAITAAGAASFSSSVTANGYRFAYAAKSSNYTLTDNDDYINVTSSCTITLPTAVGRAGKRYVIKCIGSVTATIASTSSETIDGNAASTYTFGGPNFNIMIVYSNGANWNLEAWQTGI